MEFSRQYHKLYTLVFDLYHLEENKSKLLFHGWHHIEFVHNKSIYFAEFLKCNIEMTAVCALLHDLNYIYSKSLEPTSVRKKTRELIKNCGYDEEFTKQVLINIENTHLANRGDKNLSKEAQALSDADSLFKILPSTSLIFSPKYLIQNRMNILELANKIVTEQKPLLTQDKFFYTEIAKKMYMDWAQLNIYLWEELQNSIKDPDINKMITTARNLGVI